MESPETLSNLLKQAYFGARDGTSWHGPSVQRVVDGVTFELASSRPPAGHSIWELVLHIVVWDEICVRRLTGEVIAITTGDPGDWPDVPEPSEQSWRATRARLNAAQLALVETVARLQPEAAGAQTPGCRWTNHTMIHGTLHHDLYHAGQIALLRRALSAGAPTA